MTHAHIPKVVARRANLTNFGVANSDHVCNFCTSFAGPNGLKDYYPLDILMYGSGGSASRGHSKGRYKRLPMCRFWRFLEQHF